jgi:hypothetical protein
MCVVRDVQSLLLEETGNSFYKYTSAHGQIASKKALELGFGQLHQEHLVESLSNVLSRQESILVLVKVVKDIIRIPLCNANTLTELGSTKGFASNSLYTFKVFALQL